MEQLSESQIRRKTTKSYHTNVLALDEWGIIIYYILYHDYWITNYSVPLEDTNHRTLPHNVIVYILLSWFMVGKLLTESWLAFNNVHMLLHLPWICSSSVMYAKLQTMISLTWHCNKKEFVWMYPTINYLLVKILLSSIWVRTLYLSLFRIG